ncbi:hypothetical protein [Methanosarcina acetivorans]|nr:hypothetical protein [Methanosarcina acetivorans]
MRKERQQEQFVTLGLKVWELLEKVPECNIVFSDMYVWLWELCTAHRY